MPLTQRWRVGYLTPSEIPEEIRESPVYRESDWWLDHARITMDGKAVGLWFETGAQHLWRLTENGWRLVRTLASVK